MGLVQAHFSIGSGYSTATSARRMPTFSTFWTGANTLASQATGLVNHAITLRKWYIRLATAPGGSVSRTWTVYKNGSPTALTITISGSNTTGNDTSNSVSFAAGDTTYVEETVSGGTPADCGVVQSSLEIENPDNDTSIYGFGDTNSIAAGATEYTAALGGSEWAASTLLGSVAALDGTITGYRLQASGAAGTGGSGKARTFVIQKNGTDQDGSGGTPNTTITLLETATTGSATFSLDVAPTDLIRIKETPTSSPNGAAFIGSLTLVADNGGEWSLGGTIDEVPSNTGTEYTMPFGAGAFGANTGYSTTEADREAIGPHTSFDLDNLYVVMSAASGASKSWTFTLRKNQADSAQTVTISGASDVSGTSGGAAVTLTSSDRASLSATSSGSPANLPRPSWAFLMTDPAAAGTEGTLNVTLDALTLAATSGNRDGTLAVTLGALTLAATGEVVDLDVTVDQFAIEYALDIENQAPVADAGPDQSDILVMEVVDLAGSATDDGEPYGSTLTYLWTKLSGPGTATFDDDTDPTTQVTFSMAGTYVLQLYVTDGDLSDTDTMTVEVGTAVDPGNTICGEDLVLTWIEQTSTETDEDTSTRVTSDIALPDPSTYYFGKKEPRILELPTISRVLSDTRGQWQAGTMRWREAEVDRIVRRRFGAATTYPLTNTVDVCRMIRESDWRDRETARLMFVGHRLRSTPADDLSIQLESGDFLARDLEKAGDEVELPKRLFATEFIPGIPTELIEQPEPIIYGNYSDASHTATPPELVAESTAAGGTGGFMDGTFPVHGHKAMPGPDPPASLSLLEGGSGSLMTGDVPGDDYYFTIVGFNESGYGDPAYFDLNTETSLSLTGDNKKITVSWTNPGGTDADTWRVSMGMYYFGVRMVQYKDVSVGTTSVEFDNMPDFDEWSNNDYSQLATGATQVSGEFCHYRCAAVMSDGTTTALNTYATNVGFASYSSACPKRVARIEVKDTTIPVGATHVRVWRVPPGWQEGTGQGTYGYFEAPVSQTLANGNVYVDDDWIGTGLTVEDPHVERGKHDITAYYAGQEIIPYYEAYWHRWIVCGHAVKAIGATWLEGTTNYETSTKLTDEFGVTWLVPGQTGYTTALTTNYRDFNGRRYTIIYGRGPDADELAEGTGTIRVNVQGTEDAADGSGTLITDVYAQFQHFFLNYLLQDWQTGAYLDSPTWDPIAGWPKVDTDSWDDASDAAETAYGDPVTGAGVIRDLAPVREWLARWLISTGTRIGVNAGGQWTLVRHDPTADTADRTYTEIQHVSAGSLTFEPLHDEHWTRLDYRFNLTDDTWSEGEVFDEDIEDEQGGDERPGPVHDLYFITSSAIAEFLMELVLDRHKFLPWRVSFETINLCGTLTDLGDVIGLTHTAGLDVTGWENFLLMVEGHDTLTGAYRTRITARCNLAPHLDP
jgi:hypothetical protein